MRPLLYPISLKTPKVSLTVSIQNQAKLNGIQLQSLSPSPPPVSPVSAHHASITAPVFVGGMASPS